MAATWQDVRTGDLWKIAGMRLLEILALRTGRLL
jgi:hypothetical protein